ncbi:uncharacterized protein LOC142168914 [Nicotiana tabacum]|uniref:Uncharacterized protein LOC142168914 n=1 Tax=Nicotiana tabacum TaxID=4097 RepID=A0AC58SMI3_TOBAC
MISDDQNKELCRFPTMEEVKNAVIALSGDSANGPDGFTGLFFQQCWDTVGSDIYNMLQQFYIGSPLPKYITHTNLVLLPQIQQPQTFSDLRPISLSNFINKIITDIRLRGKPANVVIKLDMAKTYDRVSWKVLSRSLDKLFEDKKFIGFRMPKWTDPLNHMAYADDTIIFSSDDPYSLRKVVEVLKQHEHASGQLINKSKSSYYIHEKVARDLVHSIGCITEIQDVAELRDGNTWDDLTLDQNFPEDISDHIRHNVPFDPTIGKWDTPQWMLTTSGKFSVKSA